MEETDAAPAKQPPTTEMKNELLDKLRTLSEGTDKDALDEALEQAEEWGLEEAEEYSMAEEQSDSIFKEEEEKEEQRRLKAELKTGNSGRGKKIENKREKNAAAPTPQKLAPALALLPASGQQVKLRSNAAMIEKWKQEKREQQINQRQKSTKTSSKEEDFENQRRKEKEHRCRRADERQQQSKKGQKERAQKLLMQQQAARQQEEKRIAAEAERAAKQEREAQQRTQNEKIAAMAEGAVKLSRRGPNTTAVPSMPIAPAPSVGSVSPRKRAAGTIHQPAVTSWQLKEKLMGVEFAPLLASAAPCAPQAPPANSTGRAAGGVEYLSTRPLSAWQPLLTQAATAKRAEAEAEAIPAADSDPAAAANGVGFSFVRDANILKERISGMRARIGEVKHEVAAGDFSHASELQPLAVELLAAKDRYKQLRGAASEQRRQERLRVAEDKRRRQVQRRAARNIHARMDKERVRLWARERERRANTLAALRRKREELRGEMSSIVDEVQRDVFARANKLEELQQCIGELEDLDAADAADATGGEGGSQNQNQDHSQSPNQSQSPGPSSDQYLSKYAAHAEKLLKAHELGPEFLALVQLYGAAGGARWQAHRRNGWLSRWQPVVEWEGVTGVGSINHAGIIKSINRTNGCGSSSDGGSSSSSSSNSSSSGSGSKTWAEGTSNKHRYVVEGLDLGSAGLAGTLTAKIVAETDGSSSSRNRGTGGVSRHNSTAASQAVLSPPSPSPSPSPSPFGICGLRALQRLVLCQNPLLRGAVPSNLGRLVGLEVLDISACDFEGPLPRSLVGLWRLAELSTWGNPRLEAPAGDCEDGGVQLLEKRDTQHYLCRLDRWWQQRNLLS